MKITKIIMLAVLAVGLNLSLLKAQKYNYEMKTIGSHEDEVLGVFVNEDDTKVATCSLDETIKLWSIPDGKLLKTFKGHLGQVNNLSFSGSDKYIASGSSDHTVRV